MDEGNSAIEQAYILRLPAKYAAEVRKRLRDPEPNLQDTHLMLYPQKGSFRGRTGTFHCSLGDDVANLPLTQLVWHQF